MLKDFSELAMRLRRENGKKVISLPSGASVLMDINCLLYAVLQEIEKEESLWQSKSKREQSHQNPENDKQTGRASNYSFLSDKEGNRSGNRPTDVSSDESIPKQTEPPRPF